MKRHLVVSEAVNETVRRLALAGALACAGVAPVAAQSAAALHERQAEVRASLEHSPFGRPLRVESSEPGETSRGDVLALIDQPFGRVSAALVQPGHWCELLMLHLNVKRCVAEAGAPPVLHMIVGRKHDQPIADAYHVDFRYHARAAEGDYLAVQLQADSGPLGTRDYRLAVEAVPVDPGHTFLRFSYSYASGLAARVATEAYLATAGRAKVGFSVVGQDADGRPVYVGGVRGIAERNAMRYFLAIETFLQTESDPPAQRVENRLQRWYAATERHARQLHEMTLEDYVAMKRRELQAQAGGGAGPG